jgi:hypothetical protein
MYQKYWVFGLRPSSGILKTKKHTFSEPWLCFCPLVVVVGGGGVKLPAPLCVLESGNLGH